MARRSGRHDRALKATETMYEIEAVDSPEHIYARTQDAARIARALAILSEEQSTVVRMSFIEDRTHGDIAIAL